MRMFGVENYSKDFTSYNLEILILVCINEASRFSKCFSDNTEHSYLR